MSTSPPDALEEPLEDHVLVCSYTARAETLVSELESNDVDYVLVEADREQATELYEGGYSVVHADPESVGGLDRAGIGDARALVADVSDRVDASIVLAAREAAEDVHIVSVVEEPDRTPYHRLAGADTVVSPRQLLGRSLAGKVTTDLGVAVEIGEDFDLAELPVHHGSEFAGRTLADSGIRERFGVNVVGAWFGGESESPPSPDRTLESGTVLLVTGDESQLERCKELTVSGRMVASEVLQDEAIVSMDTHVKVVRTAAPGLVGETLAGARIRERTGCTVVAVEREGEVLSELSPDFRVRHGDELVVAGTDEGTNRFLELLG